MTVEPIHAAGPAFSFMQIFGDGPKWSITCGNCEATFTARMPMHVSHPGIPCPHCGTVNIVPIVWRR